MAESYLERMRASSHLAGVNAAYIEAMYEAWLSAPDSVPLQWRAFFGDLPSAQPDPEAEIPHSGVIAHFERIGRNRLKARPEKQSAAVESEHERKQMRVHDLVTAYRLRGHKKARIDPLDMMERPAHAGARLGLPRSVRSPSRRRYSTPTSCAIGTGQPSSGKSSKPWR